MPSTTDARKKVWVKSFLNGYSMQVRAGSFFTRSLYEQWYGWRSDNRGIGRPMPGLRESIPKKISLLLEDIDYVEKMIDDAVTHTRYDGKVEKVISAVNEDDFIEHLDGLRDALNETLAKMAVRRPLKRRIALLQQVIDLKSEPEDKANAQGRIDVLKRRLEAGER